MQCQIQSQNKAIYVVLWLVKNVSNFCINYRNSTWTWCQEMILCFQRRVIRNVKSFESQLPEKPTISPPPVTKPPTTCNGFIRCVHESRILNLRIFKSADPLSLLPVCRARVAFKNGKQIVVTYFLLFNHCDRYDSNTYDLVFNTYHLLWFLFQLANKEKNPLDE